MVDCEILLVEDNPDDEALALRAMRKILPGVEILVARDGVEALDYLFCIGSPSEQTQATPPKVILLDLKLPKIDGLEVLRRIRSDERTRLIPVVVFTSSREKNDLAESYRLGANAYVRKPVNFDEFSITVNNIVAFWLHTNENPCEWRKSK